MHDYQGLCEIWVRGGSGASTLFINVSTLTIPSKFLTKNSSMATNDTNKSLYILMVRFMCKITLLNKDDTYF